MIKNCEWCGIEFDAIRSNVKYCCVDCQRQVIYKKRKNERERARDRAYQAGLREKNRTQPIEVIVARANAARYPNWLKVYNKADKLTQDVMIARANNKEYSWVQTMKYCYPDRWKQTVKETIKHMKNKTIDERQGIDLKEWGIK